MYKLLQCSSWQSQTLSMFSHKYHCVSWDLLIGYCMHRIVAWLWLCAARQKFPCLKSCFSSEDWKGQSGPFPLIEGTFLLNMPPSIRAKESLDSTPEVALSKLRVLSLSLSACPKSLWYWTMPLAHCTYLLLIRGGGSMGSNWTLEMIYR